MLIALASTNRIKLAATHAVVTRLFEQPEIRPVAVSVEVPPQPIGDEQTQEGAIARARAALAFVESGLGVGVEGGLRQTLGGWALCCWAAVADANGTLGVGCSGVMLLPPAVVERVLKGEELGTVIDELAGEEDTRQGRGAAGILTGGLLSRQKISEDALAGAFVPWIHPSFRRR